MSAPHITSACRCIWFDGTRSLALTQGFDALGYKEHTDYVIIESANPELRKAVVRINVFHAHRQTIQYIEPHDAKLLSQAELLVIDEAAAIPMPQVGKKQLKKGNT